MTVELRDQLRELCAVIDDEQGPITIDDIQARDNAFIPIDNDAFRPSDRPTRLVLSVRRRWLVAVIATAVVVVASLPLFVLSSIDEPDVAEPVPTTLPTILPTTQSSLRWLRVQLDETVFGGTNALMDVVFGGPGLVAVGTDGPNAAVWTSIDGLFWSQVPNDAAVFGGANMAGVTVGGPGLVAVGTDGPNAAVWTSPDGVTWSRVPHDADVFGGANMAGVTVGGPGLVAVGTDGSLPEYDYGYFYGFEYGDAVVWTSPDGFTWSRVPHDETVFGGAGMVGVTAGGPGLVAVGSANWREDDAAAVWTSTDGFTWSRVPHDETVFGQGTMNSVTAGGPGLVAVGHRSVLTSTDGVTWSSVPYDEAPFRRDDMFAVASGGPGLVAVGVAGSDAAAWTSPDGIAWSKVPYDEGVFGGDGYRQMRSVIVGDSGVVIVGSAWSEDEDDGEDAAVWVARVTTDSR